MSAYYYIFILMCYISTGSPSQDISASLKIQDIMETAYQLSETRGKWQTAYNLLTEAWVHYNSTRPKDIKETSILIRLQQAAYKIGLLEEADYLCATILKSPDAHEEDKWKAIEAKTYYDQWREADSNDLKIPTEQQIKEAEELAKIPGYALCQKEVYQPIMAKHRANHELFCRYSHRNNHPLLILAPVKEEVMNLDPLLVLFHDVITNQEADIIKAAGTQNLLWILPGLQDYGSVAALFKGRKNKSSRMYNFSLPSLSRRIEAYTGMNPYGDGAEVYQVTRYRTGGHLNLHFDVIYPSPSGAKFRRSERIATLISYISDVEQGGSTIFPQLNITINPNRGSALFWFNYHRNRLHDYRLLHAACPIMHGEKIILTKWFRVWGQLFHKPSVPEKSEVAPKPFPYKLEDLEIAKYLHFVTRSPEEFVNPPEDQEAS